MFSTPKHIKPTECIPDAGKMNLATVRALNQQTHVDKLATETLGWVLIDEADVRLDLNLDTILSSQDLRTF
jgi:uncharacterized protein related to proFAR isomerase